MRERDNSVLASKSRVPNPTRYVPILPPSYPMSTEYCVLFTREGRTSYFPSQPCIGNDPDGINTHVLKLISAAAFDSPLAALFSLSSFGHLPSA